MTNHVLLDNITHQNLRVNTRYAPEFGNNVNCALTFATEFGDIQREYPILFRKDPNTDEFQSLAVMGFEKDENLFLEHDGWNASYVPSVFARGPFLIGFEEQVIDGIAQREPMMYVDMDNSRVNDQEGEQVFLAHGGNSPYLERTVSVLKAIHDGMAINKQMFAEFDRLGLIEPVNVQITIHQDLRYDMAGYYTINEEKLADLSGEPLERLHRLGYLQGAFLIVASLNNMKKLIEMKRRRILLQARGQA